MLGFIKALPIMLLLGGIAYGAHMFITNQLEGRIETLQVQVDSLSQQNVALQTAQAIQEDTIKGLEEKSKKQIVQMGQLTNRNNELSAERDSYMQIFKDHDLTRLARARPQMIENRVNSATSAVFRSVEEDSREIDQADGPEPLEQTQ